MGFSLGGALTGALSGFAAGGPWGAAAGAGLGGFMGGKSPADRANNEFREVDPRLGLDPRQAAMRQQQLQQLGQLAQGKGEFQADIAGRLQRDAGRAQLMSQAAGARQSGGLARRNAQMQGGLLAARIAGQTALGRIQEQDQARQLYNQALGQAQTNDLQRANIVENARTQRFNTITGLATGAEGTQNALAAVLPKALPALGKYFGGGQQPDITDAQSFLAVDSGSMW